MNEKIPNPLMRMKVVAGFSWTDLYHITGISTAQLQRIITAPDPVQKFQTMKLGTILALEDVFEIDIPQFVRDNAEEDNKFEF